MKEIGIYNIIHKESGKYYIGSSKDIKKRFNRHLNELKRNIHHNIYLQRAWNKYGGKSFEFKIVEHCDKEVLFEKEYLHIDRGDNKLLYNLGSVGGGDNLSNHPNKKNIIIQRSKTLKKRLEIMTDRERTKVYGKPKETNPNWKGGISFKCICPICNVNKKEYESMCCYSCSLKKRYGKDNPFFGRKHSNKTKEKIANARMGIIPTNAMKIKINDVTFSSMTEAATTIECSVATIGNRCKSTKFPKYTIIENL